jgi:hypothetical protein
MTKPTDQIHSAQTELTAQSQERMRVLVAELVQTNQELRFKIAQLNDKVARLEKSPHDDIPWAGMLI